MITMKFEQPSIISRVSCPFCKHEFKKTSTQILPNGNRLHYADCKENKSFTLLYRDDYFYLTLSTPAGKTNIVMFVLDCTFSEKRDEIIVEFPLHSDINTQPTIQVALDNLTLYRYLSEDYITGDSIKAFCHKFTLDPLKQIAWREQKVKEIEQKHLFCKKSSRTKKHLRRLRKEIVALQDLSQKQLE